mmetsp:Transcript_4738/g.13373  ORF Transcript_4738/g.13373 Transcript_4738/m.13373 type:complete len:201 (+) Transcript_4738:306-908(+)
MDLNGSDIPLDPIKNIYINERASSSSSPGCTKTRRRPIPPRNRRRHCPPPPPSYCADSPPVAADTPDGSFPPPYRSSWPPARSTPGATRGSGPYPPRRRRIRGWSPRPRRVAASPNPRCLRGSSPRISARTFAPSVNLRYHPRLRPRPIPASIPAPYCCWREPTCPRPAPPSQPTRPLSPASWFDRGRKPAPRGPCRRPS